MNETPKNPEEQKELSNILKAVEDSRNIPEFNNRKCNESCNCIEIAEAKNGGEVKNYPCLKGPDKDLIEYKEPGSEKIQDIAILAILSNGNVHQVQATSRQKKMIMQMLQQTSELNKVTLFPEPVEMPGPDKTSG